MNLFDFSQAQYFCGSHVSALRNRSVGLRNFFVARPRTLNLLREGTPEYNEFRDGLLCDIERNLFLSISLYRRSLDLMMTSSASWAFVTLYYSSFHAASAIMGLFGGVSKVPEYIVDVVRGNSGRQELRIIRNLGNNQRILRNFSAYNGPHRVFWDIFYPSSAGLTAWIPDQSLHIALTPVSNDRLWQINNRNDLNYNSLDSLEVCKSFENNFNSTNFPSSLPGVLSTQFSITEAMILTAVFFSKEFNLGTDSLKNLNPAGARETKLRNLIRDGVLPDLAQKSKIAEMIS